MRSRVSSARRATIVEVAAAARVSTATVSRVMAASGPVTAERAARVRDAVERLGYVLNGAARELASRPPDPGTLGAAGETVGRFLVGLGHRRAGYVGGGGDAGGSAEYVAAARRIFVGAGGDLAEARAADDVVAAIVRTWIVGDGARTAILCADDLLALEVIEACQLCRRAVPEQLSIVGFGDARWTAHVRPRLTTVRRPVAAGARCQLVIRQSTGPAQAG